jgi:four helix bundle protein
MQNCNSKVKIEIKQRAYIYALDVIKFIDQLNKNDLSVRVITQQLLRSATSIGANIIQAQASSSKRNLPISLTILSNPRTKASFG